MSMKRIGENLYEATRLMKDTNTELRVTAPTGDEAQAAMAIEVARYRKGMEEQSADVIQRTGEYIRSPGCEYFYTNTGQRRSGPFNHQREIPVLARPSLCELIRKEREDAEKQEAARQKT
jgi:hypothetical protein